jgi:hypothetical protein
MYPFQIIFAQFTNPVLSDNSYSAGSVYGRNTGCDIVEYGGDVYRVSVWEPNGTTQAFGWVVNIGATQYTGTLPFTATGAISDPDVCILVKPITNVIFAAVVYYDATNAEWDLEFFEWDPTSTQFISTLLFFQLDTGPFGTTINIDGNEHSASEFSVVWDDVNGNIYSTVGDMSSVILYNKLLLIDGTQPDVSMFYDGTNDVVHLTYINPNGRLVVLDYDFPTLATGSTGTPFTALLEWPFHSGYVYSFPRIASPIGSSGTTGEWTVVVEEIDISGPDYYILGFNNGATTPIIYNDGSLTSPADLTDVPNYFVSVCYDNNYPTDGIWVGWQFDDTGGNYGYINQVQKSGYSVVLQCDALASPTGSLGYLQVPTSVTSNANDYSGFLSLAGRYGSNELFLTYQNVIINGINVDDVNYKVITGASGISALRSNVSNSDDIISFDQLKDDALIEMKILSLEGKLLFNNQVLKQDIKNKLSEFSKRFSTSMYLVNLHSIETGRSFNYKYLLSQ